VRIVRADGREEACRAKFLTTVSNGDVLQVRLAGGGGHGNPFERDPEAVLMDVLEDKMSVEHAREAYGVVIGGAPPAVDTEATRRRRAR
jgi:N-methylhydantoinase B/oxoprolinase/acetone carboxylase alpha subunit